MSIQVDIVSAKDFAEQKGVSFEWVIKHIEDGTYQGQQIEGEWYIQNPPKSSPAPTSSAHSQYKSARSVASFLSFFGWLFFILGLVGAFATGIMSLLPGGSGIISAFFYCLEGIIGGLLTLTAAQLLRAVLDIADNTREILKISQYK